MFEIVLAEYGLDYLYIREHWTMAALITHIERRNERIARERRACERGTGGGGSSVQERDGVRRRDEGLGAFVRAERKAGRARKMRTRSQREKGGAQ